MDKNEENIIMNAINSIKPLADLDVNSIHYYGDTQGMTIPGPSNNDTEEKLNILLAKMEQIESNTTYLLNTILERLNSISRHPAVIAYLALEKIRDYVIRYDDDGVVDSKDLMGAIDKIREVLSGEKK